MRRAYRVVVADATGPAARRLRDAGFDVICTGPLAAEALAEVCLQEDADAVGPPVEGLAGALDRAGCADVVVFEEVDGLAEALDVSGR